jgi:hypothetical protein
VTERWRRWRYRFVAALLLFAFDCRHEVRREMRTDLAPLEKRLKLPSDVRGARWVAVPEHEPADQACDCAPELPEPDRPYRLYATIELGDAGWAALVRDSPTQATPGRMTLPQDVARVILPAEISSTQDPSGPRVGVEGLRLGEVPRSRLPAIRIADAIRVERFLVVQLLQNRAFGSGPDAEP